MNLYETRLVKCEVCASCIGEIEFDSVVFSPKCNSCFQHETLANNTKIIEKKSSIRSKEDQRGILPMINLRHG